MRQQSISRERWKALEPVLDELLELDESDRAAHVAEVCADDDALRSDVEALLVACEQGSRIFSEPAMVAFAPLLEETHVEVPERLGRYTIVRELGRGGMATVYLADDPKHGRQVAVKVLRTEVARAIGRERFMQEIEIAAGLSHPHILPLHDSGEAIGAEGSILFFVSPYVAGESMRDLLHRAGPLPVERAVALGGEIARALDYAHRQGVVHLDIKPGNILLQEGHAVIADFGIARAMSNAGNESGGEFAPLGTPRYMSPEQAIGALDIDQRSDVYSLGCVMYEMITGEVPPARTHHDVSSSDSLRASDVILESACKSRELTGVITRAMAYDRDERYASAGELGDALRRALHVTVTARRKWRRIAAGAALALVALAVVVFKAMGASPTSHSDIAREKSIAVLPFVNMSADSDEVYFSDGLTEDLITLLAKSHDMRVSARGSAFKFREGSQDPREIGRQLDVGYLLRGRVHKVDGVVHVMVQLIRTSDGYTAWAQQYERPISEIFAVRDEIAAKAVHVLKTTLLANAIAGDARPRNIQAYNLVLRARYLLSQPTQESVAQSVDYLQQAIAAEPGNAEAYALLAHAYLKQSGQGWLSVAEGYTQARAAAHGAIALDSTLADGYEALAYVQSTYDWDWDAAQANYRRALELEPGNAEVLRSAALLMTRLGLYDDAIRGLRKAVERDPLVSTYSALSYTLGAAGRWDEAEAAARTALALGPNSILRHFNLARALLFEKKYNEALREASLEKKESWRLMGLALVYHALGRHAESDAALAECKVKYAENASMQIAEVHAYRGDVDEAFLWLDRALTQHDPGIADLRDDPWLVRIRGDARYRELLAKIHLEL